MRVAGTGYKVKDFRFMLHGIVLRAEDTGKIMQGLR